MHDANLRFIVVTITSAAWLLVSAISPHADPPESLQHYLERAATAYREDRLDTAVTYYRKAIAAYPNAASAHGGLGYVSAL